MASAPLILWHGGRPWTGPLEVRPAHPSAIQHGPGLYFTTSASTAREYARGGGTVFRFEVDPDFVRLSDSKLDVELMRAWVQRRSRLKHRAEILADLDRAAARFTTPEIPAAVLLNLGVNYAALSGDHGPALAAFYREHGIDGDVVRQSGEDWVVLWNFDKVRSYKRVPAGDAIDSPRLAAGLF